MQCKEESVEGRSESKKTCEDTISTIKLWWHGSSADDRKWLDPTYKYIFGR